MLHQFLTAHRETLIENCYTLAANRGPLKISSEGMRYGIPLFLNQLIDRLRDDHEVCAVGELDEVANGHTEKQQPTKLTNSATAHGRELLERGCTVDQVVHAYGDVCQAVTELASKAKAPISAAEFKTFNLCLDNAIAAAVTEFGRERDKALLESVNIAGNARLQVLAQELRNSVGTAMLSVAVIKRGTVGLQGATAGVLDSVLLTMRDLCDQTLTEARRH